MKEVLISVQPKWCELIANGKKTIEVRKTKPKLETPFKCYIYCTKSELLTRSHYNNRIYVATSKDHQKVLERYGNITLSGKVIGEFVCDYISMFAGIRDDFFLLGNLLSNSCLNAVNLDNYLNGFNGFGWHISDLVIYDKPKELGKFKKINRKCFYADLGLAKRDCEECQDTDCMITKPPQSWCYVEGVKE